MAGQAFILDRPSEKIFRVVELARVPVRFYRLRLPGNIDQLVDTLIRLSYSVAERSEIVKLDINPLVLTPSKVVAVDARVVIRPRESKSTTLPYRHLAIRPYPAELTRQVIAETTTDNFRTREILTERQFEEAVGDDGVVIARRTLLIGG